MASDDRTAAGCAPHTRQFFFASPEIHHSHPAIPPTALASHTPRRERDALASCIDRTVAHPKCWDPVGVRIVSWPKPRVAATPGTGPPENPAPQRGARWRAADVASCRNVHGITTRSSSGAVTKRGITTGTGACLGACGTPLGSASFPDRNPGSLARPWAGIWDARGVRRRWVIIGHNREIDVDRRFDWYVRCRDVAIFRRPWVSQDTGDRRGFRRPWSRGGRDVWIWDVRYRDVAITRRPWRPDTPGDGGNFHAHGRAVAAMFGFGTCDTVTWQSFDAKRRRRSQPGVAATPGTGPPYNHAPQRGAR